MYEADIDVTYPAGSLFRAAPNWKTSSSALLTPLSVTFIPEANSTKEASRVAFRDKCKACDDPPPEPKLRICPLYCTRAISPRLVICSSNAHTHHRLASKTTESAHQSPEVLTPQDENLSSSSASTKSSQATLFDMSPSLRIPSRVPRILGSSSKYFRPQAPIALRSFSAIARFRTADTSAPNPPKEEAAALSTQNSAAAYLGTTKRLPEYNLAGKVVLVSGAGRGLGLVQAEALLEAGATGKEDIPCQDCSYS